MLDQTLLLEPTSCVFSVFPFDRFAVADPDTSRSLTNSFAASEFPSGELHKDNEHKRPPKSCYHIGKKNVLSHFNRKILSFSTASYIKYSIYRLQDKGLFLPNG